MKYFLLFLVLSTSAAGKIFAQSNKTDQVFNVPEDFIFGKRFSVDLGKGNKMQVEVSDINDLERIRNIDSILAIFLKDYALIKDSISSDQHSIRFDLITNAAGQHKIRFRQFPQTAAVFLQQGTELAPLKIEQDTLQIVGVVNNPPKAMEKQSRIYPRYYRLLFFLNSLEDLAFYDGGILNQKIISFEENYTAKWEKTGGTRRLQSDPSITADFRRAGTLAQRDYLQFEATVNLQNYKNYFVPSFSLGASVVLANREMKWKQVIGVSWEPNFLFSKDDKGHLGTYRNDFLTLLYAQGPIKEKDIQKSISYTAIFSLGYLIYRNGDFYEKNTFRLGGGRLQFHKTAIEPIIYFNDLFKGISPGLRLIQSF